MAGGRRDDGRRAGVRRRRSPGSRLARPARHRRDRPRCAAAAPVCRRRRCRPGSPGRRAIAAAALVLGRAVVRRRVLGAAVRTPAPAGRPTPQAQPAHARRPAGARLDSRGERARSLVAGAIVRRDRRRRARATRPAASTRLTVLDVGQGDAILVESRTGARMLVDGGPDPDRILLALDERIPPWDRRLDVLVLTHPHEDHVAGLARVLDRYSRRARVRAGHARPGPRLGRLGRGAARRAAHGRARRPAPGSASGEIAALGPVAGPGHRPARAAGHGHGHQQRLDRAARRGERPPVPADGRRRAGHRPDAARPRAAAGRRAQGRAPRERARRRRSAFVDAVRPRVAIASAGAGNPYGHPARSTLDRLRASGARVYRTDEDGSVEVELRPDGSSCTVGREKDAGARPSPRRRRPADPVGLARPRSRRRLRLRHPGPRRHSPGAASTAADPTPLAGQSRPAAVRLGRAASRYDPSHDDPEPPRGRPPAALARAAREVPAPRLRRRRRRRASSRPGRAAAGHPVDRRLVETARAAARRRQAGLGRDAGPPPARRGLGGLARGARLRRAGGRRSGTTP